MDNFKNDIVHDFFMKKLAMLIMLSVLLLASVSLVSSIDNSDIITLEIPGDITAPTNGSTINNDFVSLVVETEGNAVCNYSIGYTLSLSAPECENGEPCSGGYGSGSASLPVEMEITGGMVHSQLIENLKETINNKTQKERYGLSVTCIDEFGEVNESKVYFYVELRHVEDVLILEDFGEYILSYVKNDYVIRYSKSSGTHVYVKMFFTSNLEDMEHELERYDSINEEIFFNQKVLVAEYDCCPGINLYWFSGDKIVRIDVAHLQYQDYLLIVEAYLEKYPSDILKIGEEFFILETVGNYTYANFRSIYNGDSYELDYFLDDVLDYTIQILKFNSSYEAYEQFQEGFIDDLETGEYDGNLIYSCFELNCSILYDSGENSYHWVSNNFIVSIQSDDAINFSDSIVEAYLERYLLNENWNEYIKDYLILEDIEDYNYTDFDIEDFQYVAQYEYNDSIYHVDYMNNNSLNRDLILEDFLEDSDTYVGQISGNYFYVASEHDVQILAWTNEDSLILIIYEDNQDTPLPILEAYLKKFPSDLLDEAEDFIVSDDIGNYSFVAVDKGNRNEVWWTNVINGDEDAENWYGLDTEMHFAYYNNGSDEMLMMSGKANSSVVDVAVLAGSFIGAFDEIRYGDYGLYNITELGYGTIFWISGDYVIGFNEENISWEVVDAYLEKFPSDKVFEELIFSVDLISPSNDYEKRTSSSNYDIAFEFKVESNSDLQKCEVYLDGSLENIFLRPAVGDVLGYEQNLDRGNYDWYVKCFDGIGNVVQSETWKFEINKKSSGSGRRSSVDDRDFTPIVLDEVVSDPVLKLNDLNVVSDSKDVDLISGITGAVAGVSDESILGAIVFVMVLLSGTVLFFAFRKN